MINSFLTLLLFMASTWTVSMAQKDRVVNTREHSVAGHDKKVVCYWGTWANYRPNNGKFTPESIDASLCTHLIYSFVGLDADTSAIKSLDPWMDLVRIIFVFTYSFSGSKSYKA